MPKSPRAASTPLAKSKITPNNLTWEHPEGSGIKIAEIPNRTAGKVYGVSYQVRIPSELLGIPNKREMHQRRTKTEAERLAEDRYIALRKHGTEFSKIPPDAQRQAAMAWGILNEHNQTAAISLNLIDAVRAGIRSLSPAGGRKTVAEVFAELRTSKEERSAAGVLDSSTVHDFKVRSNRIEIAFGARPVNEVTHIEIDQWLRKLAKDGAQGGGALSRRSILNYRNTFGEAFRHAKARQYLADNPFDRFTREDLKNLGGEAAERSIEDINILTVAEAHQLLEAARNSGDQSMLGSLVLRLFCGLRTTEVCRLDWQEVRWLDSEPYVHVPANKAKKRRVRHVDISQNALAWLKAVNPPKMGRIVPGIGDAKKDAKTYCFRFGRIVKAAGIGKETAEGDWESEWESNDTRHSFGSYHYALHGDAMRTARLMGHKQNDDILFANYRSLVTKEAAQAYFALLPDTGAGKVTAFPKAATA